MNVHRIDPLVTALHLNSDHLATLARVTSVYESPNPVENERVFLMNTIFNLAARFSAVLETMEPEEYTKVAEITHDLILDGEDERILKQ